MDDAITRNNLKMILQHLERVGLDRAGNALNPPVDNSTVCRWKEKDIPRFSHFLSVIGLKVVAKDKHCFDPEEVDKYIYFAKKYLAQIESVNQLNWED